MQRIQRVLGVAGSAFAGLVLFAGLTAGAAAAQDVDLDAALAERALGDPDAPVTVYAYESFSCAHCAAFHAETYEDFKARYVDTGKVRFIFRDYPLNIQAQFASQIARCVDRRLFFRFAGLLFETQEQWRTADNLIELGRIGRLAGLSTAAMEACVTNQDLAAGIDALKSGGSDEFGVSTTPSFVINGTLYEGRQTIDQLAAAIDPLLGE